MEPRSQVKCIWPGVFGQFTVLLKRRKWVAMGILLTVTYVIGVIPRREAGNTESRYYYTAWQLIAFGSVPGNVLVFIFALHLLLTLAFSLQMCVCVCMHEYSMSLPIIAPCSGSASWPAGVISPRGWCHGLHEIHEKPPLLRCHSNQL